MPSRKDRFGYSATLTPIVALALALASPAVANETKISGLARVMDGDTLEIGARTIQFLGIDAPEAEQRCKSADGSQWRCGQAATVLLKSLILDNVVICYHPLDDAGRFPRDDRYGRMIAICYAILPRQHKTGGTDRTIGTSLNAKMVEAGLALAYRPYSRLFVQYENLPRRIRAGMWRGDFQKPWDWRATRRKR